MQASAPEPVDLAGKSEIASVPTRASYLFWDIPEEGEMPPNIPLEEARPIAGGPDEHTFREVLDELAPKENGYSDGTYIFGPMWARVVLENSGKQPTRWRVDYRAASGDPVRVYAILPDGSARLILDDRWVMQSSADRYPRTRLLASDPVEIAPGERVELWYDAEFGLASNFYHRLVEESRFLADRQRDTGVFAAFGGFRFALLLALLAFAAVLRDRAALAYAGFHAGLLLMTFSNAGFDNFLLALDDGASGSLFRLTVAFALICYALTLRFFLATPTRYPRYNRVLIASTVLGLVALPVLSYMDSVIAMQALRAYAEAALLAQFALVAAFGMALAVRDRLPGAGLLLVASLILILLAGAQGLFAAQVLVLPPWRLQELANGALALDGTIFAGALVWRAVELRRQRDAEQAAKMSALADRAFLLERLDEAERDYRDVAELAERRRRDLAATSHDLKQPLFSLQMALSRIEGAERAAEGVSYIETVLRRNLDETRPDPAASEAKEGLAIDRVLRNAALMFGEEAEARGIALVVVASKVRVSADPVALMRIVTNLLANAIHHSQGDRVVMGVRRRQETVDFMVADNGRGITDERLATIFEPYRSGESSQGEGLGLSVVRDLVRQAGWSISANRLPGGGMVFRVSGMALAPA